MKRIIALSLLTLLGPFIQAQSPQTGTDIVIGKSLVLQSKVLNEDRKVLIYTPEDCEKVKDNYPVFFVLDTRAHQHDPPGAVYHALPRWQGALLHPAHARPLPRRLLGGRRNHRAAAPRAGEIAWSGSHRRTP